MAGIVIKGATVIDVGADHCTQMERDITISDGIISSVGKAIVDPVRTDLQVLDGHRCYAIPGLIDAHNHLGLEPGDEFLQMQENDAMIALRAARNALQDLRSGVTSMRTLGEKNYIDLEYKRAFETGILPGPCITVSGPAIVATGGLGWYMHQEVDGVDEIRRAVRLRAKKGVDTIKVMVTGGISDRDTDPRRCYFSQAELNVLVEEAHAAGKPASAHIYGGPGAHRAVAAGVDAIEHGFLFEDSVLEAMAAKDIALIVTSSILRSDPTRGPVWRRERLGEIQSRYPAVIKRARELGLRIAIGSDCNHGVLFFPTLLKDLGALGMTPNEILRYATYGAAQICGMRGIGSIVPGNRGDLIILKDNPLHDIGHLRQIQNIIKDGQIITPAANGSGGTRSTRRA